MLKSQLDDKYLTVITFTDNHFSPNEKEITYEGKQYDVVKVVRKDAQTVQVYCFADETETALLAAFSQENTPNEQNEAQQISLFFKQLMNSDCPSLDFVRFLTPIDARWCQKVVATSPLFPMAFTADIVPPPPRLG